MKLTARARCFPYVAEVCSCGAFAVAFYRLHGLFSSVTSFVCQGHLTKSVVSDECVSKARLAATYVLSILTWNAQGLDFAFSFSCLNLQRAQVCLFASKVLQPCASTKRHRRQHQPCSVLCDHAPNNPMPGLLASYLLTAAWFVAIHASTAVSARLGVPPPTRDPGAC